MNMNVTSRLLHAPSWQHHTAITSSRSALRPTRRCCFNPVPNSAALRQCIKASSTETYQSAAARDESIGRRRLLSASVAAAILCGCSGTHPVQAGVIQDATRAVMRPDVELEKALVLLLDARGTLLELRNLAATDADSSERFKSRSLLPGMAKRLRELGPSVPPLVALTSDGNSEQQLSFEYGGTGGDTNRGAVPIYSAIGDVITISGRTIRKEAQASPERAEVAIKQINNLVEKLPTSLVDKAEAFRKQRSQQLVKA